MSVPAVAAAVLRRAAVASTLRPGGARHLSSLIRPKVPRRPSPSSRRLLHDVATKDELREAEARLRGEMKSLEARLMGEVEGVAGKINRVEIESSGKHFRSDVITTDHGGKLSSLAETQVQQGLQIGRLVEGVYQEARVSTERYSHLHGCYQEVLVNVSNSTYKLVMAGVAGFATVFLGGLQIYTVISKAKTESVVDDAVAAHAAILEAKFDAKLEQKADKSEG